MPPGRATTPAVTGSSAPCRRARGGPAATSSPAPELSPLFARALARQVHEALLASGTREVWEFGAGSGVLAAGLVAALGEAIDRYTIVDLSASLRERQRLTLAAQGAGGWRTRSAGSTPCPTN